MNETNDYLARHEKFIAFVLLGAALFALSVMVYIKPPSSAVAGNGAALAILNTIVGALTLAFGGAAGALFKISDSDRKQIGQAAADAVTNHGPTQTEIINDPTNPVPTKTAADAALPPMFQEQEHG